MLQAAWRIARLGLVAAGAVALIGWALGRAQFGSSDPDALGRIEAELRQQFSESAETLGRIATGLAAQREAIAAAGRTATAAASLFDAVDAALSDQDPGRAGITIYNPLDQPIAWAGRTSPLPKDRLAGPSILLITRDALGPRLVRIEAVVDRTRPLPARIATIVVEQQLGTVRGTPGTGDTFVISTSLVPVSLHVRVGDVAPQSPYTFVIPSPGGGPLVDAEVSPDDLNDARARWRDLVRGTALAVVGLTLLLCAGAMLDLRHRATTARAFTRSTIAVLTTIALTRAVIGLATSAMLSGNPLQPALELLATSLTGIAMVWLALDTIERWRTAGPRPRLLVGAVESAAWIGLAYTAAGIVTTSIIWAYERQLRGIVSQTSFDLLQFSLHPLDAARIGLAFGVVLLHAAVVWAAVAVVRLPSLWRTRRAASYRVAAALTWTAGVGLGLMLVRTRDASLPLPPILWAVAGVGFGTIALAHFRRRARRASQAARWWVLFVALVGPSIVMYPSLLAFMTEAEERLIATKYGPETLRQREELQNVLYAALDEIEGLPSRVDLVTEIDERAPASPERGERAFLVWSRTELNVNRVTSAVELYSAAGRLISRFAFNLPETADTPYREAQCKDWDLIDELSPFGSAQRHVLRATRAICDGGSIKGTIVVSVALDYRTLPFIESQSPYLESLQPERQPTPEGVFGRDVEFVAYGWSRAPLNYSGTSVWPLSDEVFQRASASRDPFWDTAERDGVRFRVHFLSDQVGIYALGYPVIMWRRHFVNLAELVFLTGVLYMLLLAGATIVTALTSRTPAGGRALLREIRSSFYRKLFLAFVLAAVVPVLFLAYATHAYFASQFETEVREAAARTATVAQRLVEDYVTLQQRATIDDQIMVLIRRAIDQDVNLFERAELRATSALEVFASGLLPTRTPGDVYRRIVLDRLPTFVGEQRVGDFRYLLAAAPVRAEGRDGIVTVPVTSRAQDADRQIDDLDHQLLSAAVLFSLLGAALGYTMAERIGDPINRLTRATRRIARGNLDARVVAATSDELGRLIRDFNGMAEDLKRQRSELERTQRLEAWADMARQVAHDIKNPLTPIQLSAEHAQRVNIDRGRPLSPVLDECVAAILSQVRLLRQIAAEFSSFASSATPHPAPTQVAALVEEVVGPYRLGLSGRIAIEVIVPPLPAISVDRTLLARAFTNVIENALHAMPGSGTLRIVVSREPGSPPLADETAGGGSPAPGRPDEGTALQPGVDHPPSMEVLVIEFRDTGVGMGREALRRIFEPYFSTKAIGTGLGLTIAKRNVELNGGTIDVRSERGAGTTVTITLPIRT
jgi:signal transduction histidine kinase